MVSLQFTSCYCLCNLLFYVFFCGAYPTSSFWVSLRYVLRDSKNEDFVWACDYRSVPTLGSLYTCTKLCIMAFGSKIPDKLVDGWNRSVYLKMIAILERMVHLERLIIFVGQSHLTKAGKELQNLHKLNLLCSLPVITKR